MKFTQFRKAIATSLFAIPALAVPCLVSSCSGGSSSKGADDVVEESEETVLIVDENAMPGGPQLGSAGEGPVIDKSGDSTLQAMIDKVVPEFKQFLYSDSMTDKTMQYNLYVPKNAGQGKKLPLVMFIADASTPGNEVTAPLTQGYGGLVWATDEWQEKHQCYVLVPQFKGVAVNDAYQLTDEVDMAMRMMQSVAKKHDADMSRLYATGQSMGGMIAMYYNVAYPDVFAASIFVDSHWDTATFTELAKQRFVYFIAGDSGKAYGDMKPLEAACEQDSVKYTYAQWSAQLPEARQSELAAVMLEKGAPVNIFQFEPKSVLPADGKDSEHIYSFDYAYKIQSVKEWLFDQKK